MVLMFWIDVVLWKLSDVAGLKPALEWDNEEGVGLVLARRSKMREQLEESCGMQQMHVCRGNM